MGNTGSCIKITDILSYEEARSRLTCGEYEHLELSFSQILSPPTKQNFLRQAFLGFPASFSEKVYHVLVQESSLSFPNLLCCIVVILKGTAQEKLHLLFCLASSDGHRITESDITKLLSQWGIGTPTHLKFLFTVSETCTFPHFCKWYSKFRPSLGVYDWIVSEESKLKGILCSGKPTLMTYHQFLAEQASFTERQVMAIEKHYIRLRKQFSQSKRFDLDALYNCLHPLYSYEFTKHFFYAFDLNNDGNIDSRELIIGLSMILEGAESFSKFVYSMFDVDEDGLLSREEVETFMRLLGSFCMVSDSLKTNDAPQENIPISEFISWCSTSVSMYKFHSHLKNIVYIVFGVKPDLTFNIIRQWMEMECEMTLIAGKAYYIANNEWFKGTGGPVQNEPLLENEMSPKNTIVITKENGVLKKGLLHGVDYQILSPVLWFTLEDWYGTDKAICRRAKFLPAGGVVVDMVPVRLNFYRTPSTNTRIAVEALSKLHNMQEAVNAVSLPKHVLTYIGYFYLDDTLKSVIQFLSRILKLGWEDLRLWNLSGPIIQQKLLDDSEERTLEMLNLKHSSNILIEVRNNDMSWPEEVVNIIHHNQKLDRKTPTAKINGATGLNNLGNTCFMNSSVQCLSNTKPLTVYFLRELHLHELNQDNPDAFKGLLALRYADLVKSLWDNSHRAIAPLKIRWTIAKFANQFNGFGQQDAQELLAFMLDGLHEDLNRVTVKPYTQVQDSGDRHDSEVAEEFWNNHVSRNRSIIVDLFHGQLKSTLRCVECGFTSVRFDPFSLLSLPLPENENVIVEVLVVRLDPANGITHYCLWLNNEYTMKNVYKKLREKIPEVMHYLFVELDNSVIKSVIGIDEPLKNITFSVHAFELPGAGAKPEPYLVVYNRHYVTVEKYFFEWQHRQVQLFGIPFIIPIEDGAKDIKVIKQNIKACLIGKYCFDPDFAEDLMFTINKVKQNGRDCVCCPWAELCYGCRLAESSCLKSCGYLTVDWKSAVVHLIRQYDDDVPVTEDASVQEAKCRQSQPVDLSACLQSFTNEEEIGEGEWYCEKCGTHRNAFKKLDIWRLPPILIIHLKRFSLQNGKWQKCKRKVIFPDSFDPTPFLVQSNRTSLAQRLRTESVTYPRTVLVERVKSTVGCDDYDTVSINSVDDEEVINSNNRNPLPHPKNSVSYIMDSMTMMGQKRKNDDRPLYDLYAVTAHTGQIGHGHYVSFSLNPNKQWYYYNDSLVKKTTKKRVLSESAYMLFYERRNLKLDDLLPSFENSDECFDFDASVIMSKMNVSSRGKNCRVQ